MAVGDAVTGMGAVGTILLFQPAAGVECVITCCQVTAGQGGDIVATTDGASLTTFNTLCREWSVSKIFVNNTQFLHLQAVALLRTGYTGIQTK